jgi:CubicO group peptidase (beta-lactamase class C family)
MKTFTVKKITVAAGFSFIACFSLAAQNIEKKLDAFFNPLAAKGELNGNILVAQNGKTIYQRSFGYAGFEDKKRNNAFTEFQVASITKTFTAVAVLQLSELGKIGLDTAYSLYFPAFPYKHITIRQLLSHCSGLSDQDLAPVLADHARKHPGKLITNADLIPILASAQAPLKLQPGEKWWYCNMGFQLLALLVEKRSGQPFDRYLQQHIWNKAGMHHTYLRNALLNTRPGKAFADNYDYPSSFAAERVKLEGERGYYNDGLVGASNIISTTGDFLLYDEALKDGRLLKVHTLREAFTPVTLANGEPNRIWLNMGGMGKAVDGMGWFIFEDESMGKIVWHTGGMPGCATIFLRNLSNNQVVILFDNTNSERLYLKGLSAMRILNGKPPLAIKRSLTKLYAKTLVAKGRAAAEDLLYRLKNDTAQYTLLENDMNNLGYEFMEKHHLPEALTSFELNTRLYPGSDNVFSSYGDGLRENGEKEKAIVMYKRSLALNPGNEDSMKALKELGAF